MAAKIITVIFIFASLATAESKCDCGKPPVPGEKYSSHFRLRSNKNDVMQICSYCTDWSVVMCPEANTINQAWEIRDKTIINPLNRSLVLTMMGTTEGSAISMQPFNGSCHQKWEFGADGTIHNAYGLVLDIKLNQCGDKRIGADIVGSKDCDNVIWTKIPFNAIDKKLSYDSKRFWNSIALGAP